MRPRRRGDRNGAKDVAIRPTVGEKKRLSPCERLCRKVRASVYVPEILRILGGRLFAKNPTRPEPIDVGYRCDRGGEPSRMAASASVSARAFGRGEGANSPLARLRDFAALHPRPRQDPRGRARACVYVPETPRLIVGGEPPGGKRSSAATRASMSRKPLAYSGWRAARRQAELGGVACVSAVQTPRNTGGDYALGDGHVERPRAHGRARGCAAGGHRLAGQPRSPPVHAERAPVPRGRER